MVDNVVAAAQHLVSGRARRISGPAFIGDGVCAMG
jgi:hypothetical protein